MSRDIGAANITAVDATHVRPALFLKMEFDTPRYVWSGLGDKVWDGDTYIGIGDLGSVGQVKESEVIAPYALPLNLSGTADHNLNAYWITEALVSGRYGDRMTLFEGYFDADGELVDDPWVPFRGIFSHAAIELGGVNQVTYTAQSNLRVIDLTNGRRFNRETQRRDYASDEGFDFVEDQVDKEIQWAGQIINHTLGRGSDNVPRGGRK